MNHYNRVVMIMIRVHKCTFTFHHHNYTEVRGKIRIWSCDSSPTFFSTSMYLGMTDMTCKSSISLMSPCCPCTSMQTIQEKKHWCVGASLEEKLVWWTHWGIRCQSRYNSTFEHTTISPTHTQGVTSLNPEWEL